MLPANEWAEKVFKNCRLGDVRRTNRLIEYAARQAQDPSASSHAVCKGSGALKEGTFRFLRNDSISAEAIVEGGCSSIVEAVRSAQDVIVAEDSTMMRYWHEGTEELGTLGGSKRYPGRGFIVHSAIAVNRDSEELIGLLDQYTWTRNEKSQGREMRKKVPYEEKENFKWQRCSERIRKRVGNTKNLIWVCDREADIYEYFNDKLQNGERFVVRAAYNRKIAEEQQHLWKRLQVQPVIFKRTVSMLQRGPVRINTKRKARSARIATTEVRATTVTHTPSQQPNKKPICFNAVYIREPRAPKDVEPLEWMLLTTEPIDTEKQVESIIRCYEKRWVIEDFHRVWKSGCKTRERRLKSTQNLNRVLSILAFIAVRIMQLRNGYEARNKHSCEAVLSKAQWHCLHFTTTPKKKLPVKPPSLFWAVTHIAKMAGWIETKKGLPPGYLTLWKGLERLEEKTEGWEAAMNAMAQSTDYT